MTSGIAGPTHQRGPLSPTRVVIVAQRHGHRGYALAAGADLESGEWPLSVADHNSAVWYSQ